METRYERKAKKREEKAMRYRNRGKENPKYGKLDRLVTNMIYTCKLGLRLIGSLNSAYLESYRVVALRDLRTLRARWECTDNMREWRLDRLCDGLISHLRQTQYHPGTNNHPDMFQNQYEVVLAAIATRYRLDSKLGDATTADPHISFWVLKAADMLPHVTVFDVCCGRTGTSRPYLARDDTHGGAKVVNQWMSDSADARIQQAVKSESETMRRRLVRVKDDADGWVKLSGRKMIDRAKRRIGEQGFFQSISRGHVWLTVCCRPLRMCKKDCTALIATDQCNSCQVVFRAELVVPNTVDPAHEFGGNWSAHRPWQCAEYVLCSSLYARAESLTRAIAPYLDEVISVEVWLQLRRGMRRRGAKDAHVISCVCQKHGRARLRWLWRVLMVSGNT